MSKRLTICPLSLRAANTFVERYHRHLGPVAYPTHKFSIGCMRGDELVGVAIVGKPVARHLDDGWTAELSRCCTIGNESSRHAASKLEAAAWRAARAMGYARMITYTLVEEQGTSLKAAGFRIVARTRGGGWDRDGRPRSDKYPVGPKHRWEIGLPFGEPFVVGHPERGES